MTRLNFFLKKARFITAFLLVQLPFHLRKRISVKVGKVLFPRDVFEVTAIERFVSLRKQTMLSVGSVQLQKRVSIENIFLETTDKPFEGFSGTLKYIF